MNYTFIFFCSVVYFVPRKKQLTSIDAFYLHYICLSKTIDQFSQTQQGFFLFRNPLHNERPTIKTFLSF